MEITAELNNLRMSPRKVRLVANAIRGKRVPDAERALRFLTRQAALPIEKLLKSAIANAKHNFQIQETDALVVSRIMVDGGRTLKRRRARAMGRAFPIRKRTSHVFLALEASNAPARKRAPKSNIRIVAPEDQAPTEEKTAPRHQAENRAKPKVETKPREFVRKMFRRKAI